MRFLAIAGLLAGLAASSVPAPAAVQGGHYQNFRVAIYIVVNSTKRLTDPAVREDEFARAMRDVPFDKVYLEAYRGGLFATDAEIESAKRFLESKGVTVSGGITLAKGGNNGQFGTFDFENPADRAECRHAVELAARHFNEIILDDFFFYTSKSDADIAAKGARSWTQYRLDTMRKAAQDLVLKPAKAVNPHVRMIIKYPNWYEHFQGLGYDLDREAQMFDAIHTGTETRDPEITDQLLQQYESYEIIRYLDNVRPGGNDGGWVDTYDTRYVDRYAEQLWDTTLAKAPEIVLFNWRDLVDSSPVPGDRRWANEATSFAWNDVTANAGAPSWGRVAGYSLARIDPVVGKLGNPIGIASYKPYQSSGEDFLQNYLGNIGMPIEMTPKFPTGADTVLLTQSAASDRNIIQKMKAALATGKKIVITSGFLKAMQGKGIEDIVEWSDTGHVVPVQEFINGYAAGAGASLNDAQQSNPPVLVPEIRFYTNDSWPIIRAAASDKGFPIVLMNRYSKGIIYLLAIPENTGALYDLPRGVLTAIKTYLQGDFPVRIDSDPHVALFAYDNGIFVVESFRPTASHVNIQLSGAGLELTDIATGTPLTPSAPRPPVPTRRANPELPTSEFPITLAPHSFRAFRIEGRKS